MTIRKSSGKSAQLYLVYILTATGSSGMPRMTALADERSRSLGSAWAHIDNWSPTMETSCQFEGGHTAYILLTGDNTNFEKGTHAHSTKLEGGHLDRDHAGGISPAGPSTEEGR